jgi:hypothetical protein
LTSLLAQARAKLKKKAKPKQSKNMAKKKSSKRRSSPRGFASKIPLINNPTFRKAALASGTVSLAGTALALAGQGQLANNPLLKLGLAFAVGDVVGLATQILPALGGQGLSLGGGGSNGGGAL